jgi:AAA+ ATPase superfamily predicted ATPase
MAKSLFTGRLKLKQGLFIGRKNELQQLKSLQSKKNSNLVVLRGRRRIGKSTLIQKFSEHFPLFVEIQGLSPSQFSTNQEQLDHFAAKLSLIFNSRQESFHDWTEAFHSLIQQTKNKETLILLDEISWMGKYDPLFSAKLKEAWDTGFSKNHKLMLVICGSVSFWIQDNILTNPAFEGRISLDMSLQELSLNEIQEFWAANQFHMGSLEQITLLSITGGIPKYLQEVIKTKSIEQNIINLCFHTNGFLFNEYEKIFKEIFQKKSQTMEKIVRLICEKKMTPKNLASALGTDISSNFSDNLRILESAGFISRDYSFHPDGSIAKLSYLRLKDNYLRFYLKYIEPQKPRILKGGKTFQSLKDLPNFDGILGMQFENLLLANRSLILDYLNISSSAVITSAPFFQSKNTKNKGSCQIDLLIHTNLDVYYLCEFKCKKSIDRNLIKEAQKKVTTIQLPKRSSIKPILIYEGELNPDHQSDLENYFFRMISFTDLIKSVSK